MTVNQREREVTERKRERGGREAGAELEKVVKRREHQQRSAQDGAAQRAAVFEATDVERFAWDLRETSEPRKPGSCMPDFHGLLRSFHSHFFWVFHLHSCAVSAAYE